MASNPDEHQPPCFGCPYIRDGVAGPEILSYNSINCPNPDCGYLPGYLRQTQRKLQPLSYHEESIPLLILGKSTIA